VSDWIWWIFLGGIFGVFEGLGGGLKGLAKAWQYRGDLKKRLREAERVSAERGHQVKQLLITDPAGNRALVARVEGQERLWDLLTRVHAADQAYPQLPQALADEVSGALAERRVKTERADEWRNVDLPLVDRPFRRGEPRVEDAAPRKGRRKTS